MVKKTASPSRSSSAPPAPVRKVGVREWFSDIRFSGFVGIMLLLVVLAVFVLVPTVGTFVDQQQRIAALERSVQVSTEQIKALERQRERWTDRAYVTSQARERLYYVFPGEVVYLVDNDLPPGAIAPETGPVSDEVRETHVEWTSQLLRSVVSAGLARTASP